MKIDTTFATICTDRDGNIFDVTGEVAGEFIALTPGVDSRWDEPLFTIDGFNVTNLVIQRGEEILKCDSPALMPDKFPERECDWIEAQANTALTEAFAERYKVVDID